ncbi:lysosome-associated membrane glycoprotein 1-like [Phlebotomus argentipes]|uniref:lysosome-associated membrane glycoprotein 1-like n=1 Tax=Phlebotomus argentipes TaxID=94469 RepID=UPI0028930A13|nr:lysosome-associated membrane glycoprotein 1-like [Phlebotomus argentipes]
MALKTFALLLLVALAAQKIQAASDTEALPVIPDSSTSTTTPPPETTTPTTTESTSTTTESSTSSSTTTSTTTTTEPPTTTTAAPPPPTPQPGPVPAPDMGKWQFKNATTNHTCILVQMAVQLNVSYVLTDNNTRKILYNLPANDTTVASGFCDGEKNVLQLVWKKYSTVKLTFSVNNTVKEYELTELRFDLNASDIFPGAKANQSLTLVHKKHEFITPLTMSYHCTRAQALNLTSAEASDEVTVLGQALVSRLQLEAFHTRDSDAFSTAKDCDAIDTPDIVPIAVGCALAGLVVIVLIAYLVGRRRAQARGYLSM